MMDLDLDEEPLESLNDPMMGITPLLNELEAVHEHIEERIRQLEAVTARIRQRHMWQQNVIMPQIVNNFPEARTVNIYDSPQEILVDDDKTRKKDGTYLVAKALGVEKPSCQPGSYFDCNICLYRARNPILTCCGHLFCWPCFYLLPCSYSNVKECPVCEGEVTDASVVPIYGNGSDRKSGKSKSKRSDADVPPRPQAKRIESMRQKIISRGGPFLPVEETIQQMRRLIDAIGERTLISSSATSGDQQNQSGGVSRSSFPSVLSFSSTLNSSLASTERFFENVGFISDADMAGSHQESAHAVAGNLVLTSDAVAQQDSQNLDTASEINSWLSNFATSSRGFGFSAVVVETGSQSMDTATEVASTMPSSLSSRRTRATDVASGASSRTRRRRLR